ncbi:MAG: alpha/beta hydrolase [Actinomycetes bacterium]
MVVDGEPVTAGYVSREGQRIAWQEFGSGPDVLLLLPTWSIVHSDFWRHQVPYFAERYRVIAFDGLGNGASDRPTDARRYGDLLVAEDAVAVLDARGVAQAAVAGVSQGGPWALALAARHPERISAAVFIAPNVPLAPEHPDQVAAARTFEAVLPSYQGWARWNRHYWLTEYEDFLRFFFSQCFTETGSQEQIDHFLRMGLQTTPEVLLATQGTEENDLTEEMARAFATRIRCPSLVIHGDADAITPVTRGEELARLAGSELVVMAGSGHEPQCRVPEVVNPCIDDFLLAARPGGAR